MNVVNQTDDTPARIDLYGTVGMDPWSSDEQSITVKGVKEALDKIDGDTVDIHINSYGGVAFDGIGIYNILKESEKTINIYIDAIAASAASIIAMAGDTIFMPKNAQLMIHHASTIEYGNADDFEKTIQGLKAMDKSMILTYESRFVGTEEELIELLDNETWLNSEEALAFGFVDKIVDYEPDEGEEPEEPKKDVKNSLFSKYSKKQVAAKVDEQDLKEAAIPLDDTKKVSFANKLINLI